MGPYKVQAVEGVKLRVFVSLKWPWLTTLYDNVPTVHQLNWHLNLSVALQMATFFGEQILFNVLSLWVIVHVCACAWGGIVFRGEDTNEIKRESCQDKQWKNIKGTLIWTIHGASCLFTAGFNTISAKIYKYSYTFSRWLSTLRKKDCMQPNPFSPVWLGYFCNVMLLAAWLKWSRCALGVGLLIVVFVSPLLCASSDLIS